MELSLPIELINRIAELAEAFTADRMRLTCKALYTYIRPPIEYKQYSDDEIRILFTISSSLARLAYDRGDRNRFHLGCSLCSGGATARVICFGCSVAVCSNCASIVFKVYRGHAVCCQCYQYDSIYCAMCGVTSRYCGRFGHRCSTCFRYYCNRMVHNMQCVGCYVTNGPTMGIYIGNLRPYSINKSIKYRSSPIIWHIGTIRCIAGVHGTTIDDGGHYKNVSITNMIIPTQYKELPLPGDFINKNLDEVDKSAWNLMLEVIEYHNTTSNPRTYLITQRSTS